MLFIALYRVFSSMELLSFYIPVGTDVVRRSSRPQRSRLSSHPLTILAPRVILRVRWPNPTGSTLDDCFTYPCGNREAELKSTTFSSLLLFRGFLSFLFSWPSSDVVPFSVACWCYSMTLASHGLYTILRDSPTHSFLSCDRLRIWPKLRLTSSFHLS